MFILVFRQCSVRNKEIYYSNIKLALFIGANEVDTVFLNRNNFESFIRELLLVRQYRVIIYKQATPGRNDWQEEYKVCVSSSGGGICIHFPTTYFD